MKICLLSYDYHGAGPSDGSPPVSCDPRPYLPEAEWTEVELEKETAVGRIMTLAQEGYDLFFNFCDGAWDSGAPGIEVVHALERLDVPFTGATSAFYEPSREAMKRVCAALGIDSPAYVLASTEEDVERAADTLRFPLIVKHPSSYSSIGITRDSRVKDARSLMKQARRNLATYGGALIEEFIEGREATVLVAENPDDPECPTTYTPIEYRFPAGETFKHYDMKWLTYHGLEGRPVKDPELDRLLRDVSAKMFVGLNGASFGRCDIRIDDEGRAFMLEINPNCGVYYPESDPGSADICLFNDPAGHAGFTRQIVRAALKRWERARKPWEVRSDRTGSFGLFASRPAAEGDVLIAFEGEPHHLVTRSHVDGSWDEPRAGWFARYAWPLTDEVWVTWDPDPERWKPINHSCDPSAWLEGLDVVARRDLAPGEEITLDYATFYNELMPSFECGCGADRCRGTIRGDDYLQPFVEEYGDHVSDYVRQKRGALV